jgi:hypothetical protein
MGMMENMAPDRPAPFPAFLDLAGAGGQELARVLLADPGPAAGRAGRSSLNNDGTPLQLCVSVGAGRRACRLIGDPASTVEAPGDRLARGRAALDELLATRGPGLRAACARTLAMLPAGDALAALRHGALWLAAEVAGPGLALYTTAGWGSDDDRWQRGLAWLDGLLPDARAARGVVERVRPLARPVACAIEGDAPARARAKLYFRPRTPVPLARMEIDLLCDPRVAELLAPLIGDAAIRADTLVYGLGFNLADGALCDAKLDVCAHCTPRPPAAWTALLAWWTGRQSHRELGVDAALAAGTAEVAFVGLGVRVDGELRTNLYLKPPGGG